MDEKCEFKPDYAIPPMETLKEVLENRNIALNRLAKMSGIDYEILIDVMEVRRGINSSIADKLEKALEIPSSFWLNLEKNYQETLKRIQ